MASIDLEFIQSMEDSFGQTSEQVLHGSCLDTLLISDVIAAQELSAVKIDGLSTAVIRKSRLLIDEKATDMPVFDLPVQGSSIEEVLKMRYMGSSNTRQWTQYFPCVSPTVLLPNSKQLDPANTAVIALFNEMVTPTTGLLFTTPDYSDTPGTLLVSRVVFQRKENQESRGLEE